MTSSCAPAPGAKELLQELGNLGWDKAVDQLQTRLTLKKPDAHHLLQKMTSVSDSLHLQTVSVVGTPEVRLTMPARNAFRIFDAAGVEIVSADPIKPLRQPPGRSR